MIDFDSDTLKITCVQALMEIGTSKAVEVVYEEKSALPFELVKYFYENADEKNELLAAYIENGNVAPNIARGLQNHLGNALYRDGVLGGLDWHAGLVGHANGPSYNKGKYVIHHLGPNNAVKHGTFDELLANNKDMNEF